VHNTVAAACTQLGSCAFITSQSQYTTDPWRSNDAFT